MRHMVRGFTLIELVITVLVLSIMATVGSVAIINGVQAYYAVDGSLTTLAKLRYATERIVWELREIEYTDPVGTSTGPYLLTASFPATSSTSITFTKQDATVVTIDGSSSPLTIKYDAGSAYTLTDGLSSLTFDLYQSDGVTGAISAALTAYVEINITLVEGTNSYSQRTRVGLRDNI